MSTISRRETLAWVSAVFASPYVAAVPEPAFAQEGASLWKDVPAQPTTAVVATRNQRSGAAGSA